MRRGATRWHEKKSPVEAFYCYAFSIDYTCVRMIIIIDSKYCKSHDNFFVLWTRSTTATVLCNDTWWLLELFYHTDVMCTKLCLSSVICSSYRETPLSSLQSDQVDVYKLLSHLVCLALFPTWTFCLLPSHHLSCGMEENKRERMSSSWHMTLESPKEISLLDSI